METEEYNDIVRFLESKSDKQRSWPRGVEESKDKEAKRAYRQKCESFATYDGLLFKLRRRKKPETGALASTRATGARLRDEPQDERYRVPVIEEVAATIEGSDKCSGRAKTSDVAPTTKLEGSMSNCTQQSADGEVVVVRGQSIHERKESNAKGQTAKGNEMVSFKIGDQRNIQNYTVKKSVFKKCNFLTQEYYNQYSVPIDISSWTIKECNACTIRQTNAVDCGILLCKTSSTWLRSWLAMRLIHPSSKINYEEMRIFLSLCKDFVPQDVQDALQRIMSAQHNDSSDLQTADSHSLNYQHFVPSFKHPMLDDVSPIDPLPAKCFYERDAMNLSDKKLSLKQLVNLCHNSEVEAVKHFLYGIAIDEGADGLRAISLAWDVLYPELDEDVLKPCDREISEEGTKDKEQEDEGNEEEDEEIAKDSGDVDKDDGEEEDEDNLVEKEMEGTYVGTVARELQSNIEERNKTTAASDLSVYQYSVDSEKCDGHDSDRDENGNNNVQVALMKFNSRVLATTEKHLPVRQIADKLRIFEKC
ncbi:hypothetical protein EMCRGX_G013975 [Ephydatia muelleri]